jgi:transposase-like protein
MGKIRYCPRCKSVNVRIQITATSIIGVPQKWECLDCGFESYSIFPQGEIPKTKKIKKKK